METFPKIIELSIFDEITRCANEFLSAFMEAYCKHYETQHVLIDLLEEWRVCQNQNQNNSSSFVRLS